MTSSALDDFLDLCDADPDFDSGEDDDADDPFERLMHQNAGGDAKSKTAEEERDESAKGFQELFGSPVKIKNGSKFPKSSSSSIPSKKSSTTTTGKKEQPVGGARFIPKPDHSDAVCDPYTHLRLFKNSVQLYSDEVQTIELSLKERNLTVPFTPLSRVPFIKDKGEFWTSVVIVKKPPGVRQSAKGNTYSIWEVSDLDSPDAVTLFLFGNSATAEALKFIPVGALIDLVNPSIMSEKEKQGANAKLSVSNTSQIRHIGTSRDFGFCGSRRKDGKDCMNPVNKFKCDVCIHHASAELKKLNGKGKGNWGKKSFTDFEKAQFAARMQASKPNESGNVMTVNFGNSRSKESKSFSHESWRKSGTGSSGTGIGKTKTPSTLDAVKGTPKNKPSIRMELQDPTNTLRRSPASLGNHSSIKFSKDSSPLINSLPKEQDLQRVKKELNLDPKKTKHLSERDRVLLVKLEKEKSKSDLPSLLTDPNAGSKNFLKYLSNTQRIAEESEKSGPLAKNSCSAIPAAPAPIVMTRETMLSMQKALNFVQKVGPIQKKDPNGITKKRKAVNLNSSGNGSENVSVSTSTSETKNPVPGSSKKGDIDINSEEFQEILNAKSAHSGIAEDNTQAEYFTKLERKEAIENKLLSTFSLATTAVMCRECKYIALSQSEYCKEHRHNIRIVKAIKRFFKCKDCGNRTMALDRLPKRPCNHCQSSSWLSASVGKEKSGPKLDSEKLSLRGDEEKFLGTTGAKLFL